jgi:glycosyltransferase involved in cell wall biosynthesis
MKLSIITINFNNKEDLRKTIESVISQTFTDYEYIVVDGGSTDGSVDIIKQHADKITYWVSEPDKGIYNAMNKGICWAKGEYCQFLNSGDALFSETVLETVFRTEYSEDIITGNVIETYPGKKLLRKGRIYAREQEGKSLTVFDWFLGGISHQATFIRKKLLEKYGLYDENYKIIADWKFFIQTIGLDGVAVKYIDMPIAYYDMNGISNVNTALILKERKEILKSLLPPNILEDYNHFSKMEADFHNLAKYKGFYYAGKFINKLATLYELISIKISSICNVLGIKVNYKERTF